MIKINYISKDSNEKYLLEVIINGEITCKFEHFHSDGWAVCLRNAADAIDLNDWAEDSLINDPKGG